MASPAVPVTPDTLITIKVNYQGFTRKTKLPLRDLVATTFEDRLRTIFSIPSKANCRFERYSDSAGVFVVLDRHNIAVYKQLYRAAKAKQKLKLRVVENTEPSPAAPATASVTAPVVEADLTKSIGPRPATVEDVPEGVVDDAPETVATQMATTATATATTRVATLAAQKPTWPTTNPVIVSSNMTRTDDNHFPAIPGRFPTSTFPWAQEDEGKLQATLESVARNHELLDNNIAQLTKSVAAMGLKNASTANPAMAKTLTDPKMTCVTSAVGPAAPKAQVRDTYSAAPPTAKLSMPLTPPLNTIPAAPQHTSLPPVKKALPSAPQSTSIAPCSLGCRSSNTSRMGITNCNQATDGPYFTVCCNVCQRNIPDAHYHCSTCENGDFDICEGCLVLGATCHGSEHWLIKRYVKDGNIVTSTTERVTPKPIKTAKKLDMDETATTTASEKPTTTSPMLEPAPKEESMDGPGMPLTDARQSHCTYRSRTCNNCIRELPESVFLHCENCIDFDLCESCFVKNNHGHSQKHAFFPVVKSARVSPRVARLLPAGRGHIHDAVCDGCNKFITGIRHKCTSCPDWDYCSECFSSAEFIHPGHRFISTCDPLTASTDFAKGSLEQRVVHHGIYCDGPLCFASRRTWDPIVGDRYKCAVCENKDFCANCEASPSNTHNKTHPLIKFRTPVRHATVTTINETQSGPKRTMGDRPYVACTRGQTGMTVCPYKNIAAGLKLDEVKTVVDVQPTVSASSVPSVKSAETQSVETQPDTETLSPSNISAAEPSVDLLNASFQRELVSDGTTFPPNTVFEQTWILRNNGKIAWPAGCRVRFVGGDSMCHIDPNHPAGVVELVSALESTVCYEPLAPGEEFPFTVLLRTPMNRGKATSYWRLSTEGCARFGDRLWCEVNVLPKEEVAIKEKPVAKVESLAASEEKSSTETSQMIFPKLEKESPVSSVHESSATPLNTAETADENGQSDLEDWNDDSDEGFLTDEEYDILDASDEEYLEEQTKTQK